MYYLKQQPLFDIVTNLKNEECKPAVYLTTLYINPASPLKDSVCDQMTEASLPELNAGHQPGTAASYSSVGHAQPHGAITLYSVGSATASEE